MRRRYAYKKWWLRTAATLADVVLDRYPFPERPWPVNPRKILVVRLDQIGDIVQTLPFFEALRNAYPKTSIHFLTTPPGATLLREAHVAGALIAWNCPWFLRAGASSGTSVRSMAARLRSESYDAAIELRGDVRLIAMLRWARIPVLVGYGATGGGGLLDIERPWSPKRHAVDRNLDLLESIGVPVVNRVPRWPGAPSESLRDSQRRPRLIIHPDAGAPSKRWPAERFTALIDRIRGWSDIVLVGSDGKLGAAITHQAATPVLTNKMGQTTLPELVTLVSESDGVISNDSGPAHLAAALGKPVWVIWSGTADPAIWAPRGFQVTILDHPVPCAPCSLGECPVAGHPCVTGISVDDVQRSLEHYFRPVAVS